MSSSMNDWTSIIYAAVPRAEIDKESGWTALTIYFTPRSFIALTRPETSPPSRSGHHWRYIDV